MASGTRNMVASDAQPGDELDQLRAENERLRAELEQSGKSGQAAEREGLRKAAAKTPRKVGDVEIPEGVFLSEGMREELERLGRTIDPATGTKLGDWPKTDDAVRAAR